MKLEDWSQTSLRKQCIGGGVDGFYCDGVLSEMECAELVNRCDRLGYHGIQQLYSPEVRNNDRTFIVNQQSAEALFQRFQHLLPSTVLHEEHRWELEGLHDIFRINRYRSNQYFNAHTDSPYLRGTQAQSFYTVLLYLNTVEEDFGGHTLFIGTQGQTIAALQPVAGRLAVFNHQTLHAGEQLLQGQKHAMRTDAIYRKTSTIYR